MAVSTCALRRPTLSAVALLLLGVALLLVPSAASADPTPGAVYTETNQLDNKVVVYTRGANGSLTEVQRVDTGGVGSPVNNPPFPQNHLDAVNEVELTDNGRLLFVVNAGSNEVSSFRVGPNGKLTFADIESSGGTHPVSVDSHRGLLYVLNELDQSGNDLSGLRYTPSGKMTPIPGSTEALASPFSANNGFGFPSPLSDQVLFSPDGDTLVVPERTSFGFQGQIDTFALGADGTPGPAQANASNDFIPFGMAFDNKGHLIVANGGSPLVAPPFQGSGSSYSLSGTTLTAIDNVSSQAQGTCWVSITDSGKYAFMSDQNTAEITRFAIDPGGDLTWLGNTDNTGPGSDTALSENSRYLYVLNVLNANGSGGATIDRFRVKSDGSLVLLGTTDSDVPDSASGLAAQ